MGTIINLGNKEFLPEARYSETTLIRRKEKCVGQIVHVTPIEFLSREEVLSVEGKNFKGIIPEKELSVYPLTYFEGSKIPKLLYKIFRMHQCITAEIIDYDEEKNIYILSRKKTMEKAIATEMFSVGNKMEAKKIMVYQKTTFIDLGAGITAIIPIKEISSSFVSDAEEFFKGIDYIPVKIISNINNRIVVSHKDYFEPKEIVEGDVIQGKIQNLIPDGTGVFVEISPVQTGILDIDNLTVVESEEDANEYDNVVIKGKTYSFLVQRVRPPKDDDTRIHMRYCLRLI